ncbi:hypothetical protein NLI96_g12719 [Meripilus lineatus]|uniref:Uncharacterized protein n=1 Tax=Meripilus lineatus TaxID=2056292 RepID=A0AAD5UPE9_9APHY|nr:hypothetical protein NLI96_g12719 [Physisporinus lineatus]
MSDVNPNIEQEIFDTLQRILKISASSPPQVCNFTVPTKSNPFADAYPHQYSYSMSAQSPSQRSALLERVTLIISLFVVTDINERSLLFAPSELSADPILIFRCRPILRLDDTLTDLNYLSIGAFTALRTWGLYVDSVLPALSIMTIFAARVAIVMYLQVNYTPIAFGPPLWGCGATFHTSPDTTSRIWRQSTRCGIKTPVVALILRDGTVYFMLILVIQVLAIVSNQIGHVGTFDLFNCSDLN